jgi:hypothetical protein
MKSLEEEQARALFMFQQKISNIYIYIYEDYKCLWGPPSKS